MLLVLLACTSPEAPADPVAVFPEVREAWRWPFSAESPWNLPLGDGLVLADEDDACTRAVRDRSVDAWVNAETWSHPVFRASSEDPVVSLWEDGAFVMDVQAPLNAAPSLPAWPDGDAHLYVIDPAGAEVVELWKARPRQDGGWEANSLAVNDLYGSGIGNDGVRIYGGSALGGLWREGELDGGAWHALALSLPLKALAPRFVWPATDLTTTREASMTGPVPIGALVALPQDVPLDAFSSRAGRALARTLRDYGAYVVDHASGFALYAEPTAADEVEGMRDDIDAIRARLSCALNNDASQPGGPGARVNPLPPPFVASP